MSAGEANVRELMLMEVVVNERVLAVVVNERTVLNGTSPNLTILYHHTP